MIINKLYIQLYCKFSMKKKKRKENQKPDSRTLVVCFQSRWKSVLPNYTLLTPLRCKKKYQPEKTGDILRRHQKIGFPGKWRLRNKHRNSIQITRYYPDIGSGPDWSCRVGYLLQPIRSTTTSSVWILSRHFAGKPVVASQNVGCYKITRMVIWLRT